MNTPANRDALEAARRIVVSYDQALALADQGHTDAAVTIGIAAIQSFDDKTQWFEIARGYVRAADALEDAARKIEARSELYTSEDQMCAAIIDHCRAALVQS